MDYRNCTLCPRECGVDRTAGETGFCGCGDTALAAKTMLNKWEEPVLAGSGGSGAIFFGGCTLGCVYCQNRAISACPTGKPVDSRELRTEMENLIAQGAENIDLVTPTQFLPTILPALEKPLPVPVVYNCGGYEKPETLESLRGKVDIFLPDMKYGYDALAQQLSSAPDYVNTALTALKKMHELVGDPQWEGEKLKRGVIVRHLILPGHTDNSLQVLDLLSEVFKPGQILVSLMRQYTPISGMVAPLDRPLTDEEFQGVLSWMYLCGFQGFTQEKEAADTAFIPDF